MTVSTTSSTTTLLGNGSTTAFDFNFIADSAANIAVIFTDTDGSQTTLSPSQYTLVINPAATGQIWGVGGTVTYPLAGSPIANGTMLTITRTVPFTQTTTISNQGDFAPQVIEEALDTLCFEIQQLAARTGQLRGTWVSGTSYNFGDIVVDGANGNNSGNFYLCAIGNVAGVWADDLAAGDWVLAIQSTVPVVALPIPVANGGTGATTAAGARAAFGIGSSALHSNTFFLQSASNLSDVGSTSAAAFNLSVPLLASQAVMEGASSTVHYVSPGRQQYHPSAPKAWGIIDNNGTTTSIVTSYNISSAVRSGAGTIDIIFTTGFSTANFSTVVSGITNPRICISANRATAFLRVQTYNISGNVIDDGFSFACFGDQ